MSWSSIFWLLVVLIDKCVNQDIKATHPKAIEIKTLGRNALIKCNVDQSTLQSTALHWYKAKSGEALQRIMYFEAGSKTPKIDQGGKYRGSISNTVVTLTIPTVTYQDAGTYYCAYYTGGDTVLTDRGNLYKNLLGGGRNCDEL